jgi:hypothetical protein
MILINDAAVRERCFNVRCNAVLVTVNSPNQCISWCSPSSTKIFFKSSVGFLDSNYVSSCIRRARYSLFEIEIPSILIWQILKFDPKDSKLRFELEFEFPFCFIMVSPCRFKVFNGGPMRFTTNFTLVTGQNTW